MSVPHPRWRDIAAAAIFAALAGAFLWFKVLSAPAEPTSPAVGDLLGYYYPTLKYGFSQLRAGALPLWNPYQSCGTPLFAVPQVGFFYPLYLPFLFLSAEHAVTLDIVIHLCLAGLGTYLLCRRFGLEWPAAIAAGVIYAYGGTMLIKLNFPNFLLPAAWLPFFFLLADRVVLTRRWRECGLLAAVIGITLLGSLVQFLYYIALGLAPFVACRLALVWRRHGLGETAHAVVRLLVAVGLGVAVALVRLVPNAEYMAESWRPPGSFSIEDASFMAIPPDAFLENLFLPTPVRMSTSPFSPTGIRRQAYVGTIPLALALLGLLGWRQPSVSIPIAVAGLGAVLYSFGAAGGLFPLLFPLPAGNWFRGLERALIVFGFAVAVLAGGGIHVLLRAGRGGDDGPPRWHAALALTAAVAAVLIAGAYLAPWRARSTLYAYAAIGWLVLALGLAVRRRRLRIASVVLVMALVGGDLFYAYTYSGVLPQALGGAWTRYDDFFAAIRARQGFDRTFIWASFGSGGGPLYFYDVAKAGMNHGLWMCTDYDAVGRRRFAEYLAALASAAPVTPGLQTASGPMVSRGYATFALDEEHPQLFDLMGIRFLLLPDDVAASAAPRMRRMAKQWTPIMQDDGVTLVEYRGALPRAFVVHRVEEEADDARLLARLKSEDLRAVALIEQPPEADLTSRGGGAETPAIATIVGYSPGQVDIDVESSSAGFLVLTDQYDAGWQATVRGKPATLYRADYLFRGVFIPAGHSRVTFRYRPRSFQLGLAGSFFGLAGILLVLAPWERRDDRNALGSPPLTSLPSGTGTETGPTVGPAPAPRGAPGT